MCSDAPSDGLDRRLHRPTWLRPSPTSSSSSLIKRGYGCPVPVLGHPLRIADDAGQHTLEIGVVAVIILAFAAGVAGWALLAVLERLTRRAIAIWTTSATLVLLVSFLPPAAPGADTTTRLGLGLMHIAWRPCSSRACGAPACPQPG
jgi:hypothetical protein